MEPRKLKIALIGCGQIADAHLQEIRKIAAAEPVAVCDKAMDLAKQAAARFSVPGVFDDLAEMMMTVRPDVLHITTPPHTHRDVAIAAMKLGAHIYVEKPFSVDAREAREILKAAEVLQRLVCLGHDQLFDPAWEDLRNRWHAGQLGRVVHVDSFQGYNLEGPFGKAFASDPEHWVHRLPGGLFQNVMSHALYRITEFMDDDRPEVWATSFGSISEARTPTELRVMLRGKEVTANLVFSSLIRPVQRITRIHGTRESLEINLDGQTLRSYKELALPGAFAKIEAPYRHSREALRCLRKNIGHFLRYRIHYFAGMNRLFRKFYDAIVTEGDPPVSYRDIVRVTAIMDEIFAQCDRREVHGLEPGGGGAHANGSSPQPHTTASLCGASL